MITGRIATDKAAIILVYMDDLGFELENKQVKDGVYPTEKNEIVVSQGMLDVMGIKAVIGDVIKLPFQIEENGGLSYIKEAQFKICGFIEDTNNQETTKEYLALISKKFVEEHIAKSDRSIECF